MRFKSSDPKAMGEELWDKIRFYTRGLTLPQCELCGRPIFTREEAWLATKG
ncbi:hypothetical protein [Thermosulfurimonas dismutans]|uniref:Uncharacterized protein n=1 Tax=Thermosulfurimonas dismutans TaxID=999894 RepID=A0A179D5I9_9BACT|nr:hypothetical protein [Thermosulfurimonas dismutans]OAQ20858.1 hypothetical protein TDIS_0984 [Thermosulfurimonas dismutans]